jgi:hypothetical protein
MITIGTLLAVKTSRSKYLYKRGEFTEKDRAGEVMTGDLVIVLQTDYHRMRRVVNVVTTNGKRGWLLVDYLTLL